MACIAAGTSQSPESYCHLLAPSVSLQLVWVWLLCPCIPIYTNFVAHWVSPQLHIIGCLWNTRLWIDQTNLSYLHFPCTCTYLWTCYLVSTSSTISSNPNLLSDIELFEFINFVLSSYCLTIKTSNLLSATSTSINFFLLKIVVL